MPKRREHPRTLADGTVKVYSYPVKPKSGPRPKTVGMVMEEYRRSADFRRLAHETRVTYLRAMNDLAEYHGTPIDTVRRRHLKGLQDAFFDTPAKANQVVAFFVTLLSFAVDREYIAANPGFRLKKLKVGEYTRWSNEQLAYAMEHFSEHIRRAVVLALYTGQREGDCIRMTWADYDGQGVRVTQEKTEAKLWVPCHPALKAELDAWKAEGRGATTILTTKLGAPYKNSRSFASTFADFRKRHPIMAGVVFHGLRKTAAAKLAEAGCSAHEIAAVTGHRSLSMVQHYTREAEQRTRATAAILKLSERRK